MRTTFRLAALLAAAFGFAQAGAATLNISYLEGSSIGNAPDACKNSAVSNGLHHNFEGSTAEYCWLTLPLPLKEGDRVQQITVFYERSFQVDGHDPFEISAGVGNQTLSTLINNYYTSLAYFDLDSAVDGDIADSHMSSTDLVTPANQFIVTSEDVYGLSIKLSGAVDFFGVRVVYQPGPGSAGSAPVARVRRNH
jgi:hypothetical protein